nr:hypothetical protein [Coxiella burnetii]
MRMSEAKYGKTMMSSIVPVFRFTHTGYFTIFYLLFDRNNEKPSLLRAGN